MPDPTRFHAYLARTKDQEKDVIAMPDGAGGALCVSFDKHWTYSRPWDMLHIIAPLVEEADLKRTRAETDADRWRRAHSIVEQERDTARRERDGWEEKYLDTDEALHRTRQERDEWRARAEAAEAEAVARAIEAKEDPIMVRTRELLDLAYPGEYAWTGAFETCRRIAEAEARLEAGDE